MPQKNIALAMFASVAILIGGFFVYSQFTGSSVSRQSVLGTDQPGTALVGERSTPEAVIPDSIDDIILSIESDASADLAAFDEEESGALSDIDADSENVNSLGASYDENNF